MKNGAEVARRALQKMSQEVTQDVEKTWKQIRQQVLERDRYHSLAWDSYTDKDGKKFICAKKAE